MTQSSAVKTNRLSTWRRWPPLAGFLCLIHCSTSTRAPGLHPVGVTTVSATDHVTGKALQVEVWYPAVAGAHEQPLLYGDVYPGQAARDAAQATLPQLSPLVVIGHGLKSSRFDMSWLAESLAANGMIVAAVDHPGTSADTWNFVEAVKMWRRAQQLSDVIDAMLAHPTFGHKINEQKIAAVGHSAGGSAVLLMGGAVADPERFARRYPASAPFPAHIGYDPRIRAIIALAPGTGRVFAPEGIAQMKLPALIVSGTADTETPEPFNAQYYDSHLQNCQWHSIPNVGHYTFKPVCNLYGKIRSRGLCMDKWGVNRQKVHDDVITWSQAFLKSIFG